MEAVVALVLGVVVFMHAWQLFGQSGPRTTGVVGAIGAVALVALASQSALPMITQVEPEALAASALTWAFYAALVAAVGLWGFDARGMGLYSAYAAVVMIGQVIYCATVEFKFTWMGIICGAVQAVAFAMLFLYLAIPLTTLKKATSWVLVVVGPVHGILGALLLLGVPGFA